MDESFCASSQILDNFDRGGLQTLGAFFDGELHLLAFLEIAIAIAFNCGVVDENIRAAFASEEAVAFFAIKPLDRTDYTF